MITVNAAFGQEEKVLGTLGRIGENETRQIVFDCADILTEYPGAEIICVMQRHCDRTAYLADAVLAGNVLTVTLTDTDVSASGNLRIELRALVDGKIRKSAVYTGKVVSALRGEQDRPGNPMADVLNRIDMTISRAEESIAEAEAAAQSAREVANTVQAKLDNGDFVGPAGKDGANGKDGASGKDGEQGPKGDTYDDSEVRAAINEIKKDITNLTDYTTQRIGVRIGSMYSTGQEGNETNRCKTYPISCKEVKIFKIVKPNTIAQTLYMCYKNGAWTTNKYTGYTLVGNTLTITDSEIEKVLIVFKNATDSDITAEEIGGTYLIPYIDVYERLDSGEQDIRTIKNRSRYSTTRYQLEIGYVNVRNEEDDTQTNRLRTPEIDTRIVKIYEKHLSSGLRTFTIIVNKNGLWSTASNSDITETSNYISVADDVDYFRIVYRNQSDSSITTDELKNTYLLPYIDTNKRISIAEQDIEYLKNHGGSGDTTIVDINGGVSNKSRNVQTARRSGAGRRPIWSIVDDDGRSELMTVWLPMLQRNEFTMTVALITSKIGVSPNFITWEQAEQLRDAGVEFCSHTNTHPEDGLLSFGTDEAAMRSELEASIATLAEHGYTAKHLVYPQNKHNEVVRRVVSEYFDCAIAYAESSVINNVPPIRSYRLSRQEIGRADQTLDDYKSIIDGCISGNSWLITMSHSQPAFMHNPEIIEQAIRYAIDNGVTVCSVGEAMKSFANVIEVNTDVDNNYTGIDADGIPFGNLKKMIVQSPPSDFDGDNIFDCFPRMTKVTMSITAANGIKYKYPNGGGGGVVDILVHSGNYYSYMEFRPLNSNRIWKREYSNGWGDWTNDGQFSDLKIGNTALTETQLKKLLALLN